jgi:hypothetical protein
VSFLASLTAPGLEAAPGGESGATALFSSSLVRLSAARPSAPLVASPLDSAFDGASVAALGRDSTGATPAGGSGIEGGTADELGDEGAPTGGVGIEDATPGALGIWGAAAGGGIEGAVALAVDDERGPVGEGCIEGAISGAVDGAEATGGDAC